LENNDEHHTDEIVNIPRIQRRDDSTVEATSQAAMHISALPGSSAPRSSQSKRNLASTHTEAVGLASNGLADLLREVSVENVLNNRSSCSTRIRKQRRDDDYEYDKSQ